jgi:hypothetical protein
MNSMRNTSPPLPQGEQHHLFPQEHCLPQVMAQADEPCNRLQPRGGSFIAIMTITTATIVGTIIWVLNILDVLHISWVGAIGAILSAIGILLALWPLDAQIAKQSKNQPMDSANLPYTSPRKLSLWTRKKRGILHVRVRKQLRHTTIALYRGFNQALGQPDAAASISGRLVEGEIMYIGTFPSLEPGNYTVATQNKEYIAIVTIYAGVTTGIDWR